MGYTTDFSGAINIEPPLNELEVEYLQRFNTTRRMERKKGPYYANPGSDGFGQDQEPDITQYNRPPQGQPSLWCGWTVSDDGTQITWDGGEKFYESPAWMEYIINHFLCSTALARRDLNFLQCNHTMNGVIEAQGEDPDDRWTLTVTDNKVTVS